MTKYKITNSGCDGIKRYQLCHCELWYIRLCDCDCVFFIYLLVWFRRKSVDSMCAVLCMCTSAHYYSCMIDFLLTWHLLFFFQLRFRFSLLSNSFKIQFPEFEMANRLHIIFCWIKLITHYNNNSTLWVNWSATGVMFAQSTNSK